MCRAPSANPNFGAATFYQFYSENLLRWAFLLKTPLISYHTRAQQQARTFGCLGEITGEEGNLVKGVLHCVRCSVAQLVAEK